MLWLFLTVPWAGLQCVIVVFPDHVLFPDHTHLLLIGLLVFNDEVIHALVKVFNQNYS